MFKISAIKRVTFLFLFSNTKLPRRALDAYCKNIVRDAKMRTFIPERAEKRWRREIRHKYIDGFTTMILDEMCLQMFSSITDEETDRILLRYIHSGRIGKRLTKMLKEKYKNCKRRIVQRVFDGPFKQQRKEIEAEALGKLNPFYLRKNIPAAMQKHRILERTYSM